MSDTGIRLATVFLSNSSLQRPFFLDDKSESNFTVALEQSYSNELSDKLVVKLGVRITFDHFDKFEIYVEMTGIFTHTENLSFPLKDFATINAPAILFPFVREHVATLTSKADINTVLLPPVNFVALAQEQQEHKPTSTNKK